MEHTFSVGAARARARASRFPTSLVTTFAAASGVAGIACLTAAIIGFTGPDVSIRRVPTTAGIITSFAERSSHNGRYGVEVISADVPAIGVPQSWTIHLSHHARRVSHAQLLVRAWMPEGVAKATTRPHVRFVGHGNYRVSGLRFTAPGWWNVALMIDGAHGNDSVAFNVVIPPDTPRARR